MSCVGRGLVLGVGLALVAACGSGGDSAFVVTQGTGSAEAAQDVVDELVPASLPDGWQRCGGAPSSAEGASSGWWSQSFGPLDKAGTCDPVVTVTQVPPGDSPTTPQGRSWRDVKVGDNDGSYLKIPDANTQLLLMWAFRQNLIFEADLDVLDRKDLKSFAAQAYEGQREFEPEGCDDERSDLSAESVATQLSSHDYRMFLADGCPVRFNVAAIGALDDNDHCWPGLDNGRLGDRHFYMNPSEIRSGSQRQASERSDAQTELPPRATDTGYRQGDRALWVDPADDNMIYVVYPDHIEAWPVVDGELLCA